MTINLNLASKMYSLWSIIRESCKLNLHFPDNEDLVVWYEDLSFVARALTYLVILGIVFFIIVLILNYLGVCNEGRDIEEFYSTSAIHDTFVPTRFEQGENEEFIPKKPAKLTCRIVEQDLEACSSGGSSEELYDEKICIICFEQPRNCFFVPCGHCATCYDCAERIKEEDNRACPICRRLIHKVRKLFNSDI